MPPTRFPARRSRGAALIMLVALLAMGMLYFMVSQLEAVSVFQRATAPRTDGDPMAQAKDALLGYAATYRDKNASDVYGYLPCPDMDGDGFTEGNCGTAGETAIGLLPYKTLGLPDLRDASGNCLWYAVSGSYKYSPKGSTATTPVALNWDTQGMLAVTSLSGGSLVAPDDGEGGAAAVIFAPGVPLGTQARTAASTTCRANPNASATEFRAWLDGSYAIPSAATVTVVQGSPDSSSNNDALVWISPREIFNQVVRRSEFKNAVAATPAGQVNTLTSELKAVLEKRIQDDLVAGTSPSSSAPYRQSGYAQYFGKLIGDLPHDPAAATLMTPLNLSAYDAYADNWYDQFRYAECSTLSGAASGNCLSIGGTSCRGALMFAGRSPTATPRRSSEKPNASTPALGRTPLLVNYFESGSGLELLNSATLSFTGATSYVDTGTDASRSADVGTCLFPGSFVSFARDIASFAAGQVSTTPSDPQILASNATNTIQLYTTTDASRSGCMWFANPLDFKTLLRVYFRFQITTKGQGFTFTIADAVTNNVAATNPPMCGATGTRLGYAGPPAGYSAAGIKPPKLGMEIDFISTTSATSRNDPTGDHLAFIYWGGSSDNTVSPFAGTDDINHGAGTTNSATAPRNPRVLTTSSVTAMSWAGGTVTVTTSADHELWTGQSVTLAGASPTGYNGTYTATVLSSTQFTFPLGSDPGSWTGGGGISTPRAIATVQSSDPYMPYNGELPATSVAIPDNGTSPHDTVFHVRLDIGKSYDGSSTGTYTLKAYVGDRFKVYDPALRTNSSCQLTDFMNLAKNLEDICTQTPKLVQSNLRIQNISGEAFAKIYAGFTTSRSSSSSDDQDVTISNFMMRVQ